MTPLPFGLAPSYNTPQVLAAHYHDEDLEVDLQSESCSLQELNMRRFLALIPMVFVAVAAGAAQDAKKPPPAARVTVAAELACLHCTFGVGDGCAVCLKLDDKTPLVLAGKAAKQFEDMRLSKKVLFAVGAVSIDKEKRLVLTSDEARLFTMNEKALAPPRGEIRVEGTPTCGKCNLKLCDECTIAVLNGTTPIVLDGKLALDHADDAKAVVALGRPHVDKRGLLRLFATKVELVK